MEKRTSGPVTGRAKDFYGKIPSAVPEFKPCERSRQTALPDNRLIKGDLLLAVNRVLKAQTALMNELYILENQLEASIDSDEEAGR